MSPILELFNGIKGSDVEREIQQSLWLSAHFYVILWPKCEICHDELEKLV